MEALNQRSTKKNAMKQCMNELTCNGYIISDFSSIWCQALHKGNPDVATVSELTTQCNQLVFHSSSHSICGHHL